jgi:hypothetical protein
MSGEELADHLNRNIFLTSYGTEYEGGRGTYKLIKETYHWLVKLELQNEADKVAKSFVKPDGTFAYK